MSFRAHSCTIWGNHSDRACRCGNYRFSSTCPSRTVTMRAILADILDDSLRAGQIIHGMRTLLTKREIQYNRLIWFGSLLKSKNSPNPMRPCAGPH